MCLPHIYSIHIYTLRRRITKQPPGWIRRRGWWPWRSLPPLIIRAQCIYCFVCSAMLSVWRYEPLLMVCRVWQENAHVSEFIVCEYVESICMCECVKIIDWANATSQTPTHPEQPYRSLFRWNNMHIYLYSTCGPIHTFFAEFGKRGIRNNKTRI